MDGSKDKNVYYSQNSNAGEACALRVFLIELICQVRYLCILMWKLGWSVCRGDKVAQKLKAVVATYLTNMQFYKSTLFTEN